VSRCERVALAALTGALCLCAQPRTESDIHYAPGPAQTLDLYIPAKSEFTTIVYTYGGGWHSGSGKSSAPIAVELSRLGYGCVLVSHRLFPPDTFPAPAEDLAAAFAWVKSNIGSRGGDPNKIILAGHSSGAQLSLLIATDPSYLRAWRLNQSDIQAVIGLSSPVDLTRHPDGHGYGDVLLSGHGADAFRRDEALLEDASPTRHVSRKMPPALLIVGENDFPMLEADARSFGRRAEDLGNRVQVVVAPGKDHLGTARGMADKQDFVLATVLAFLKTQVTK